MTRSCLAVLLLLSACDDPQFAQQQAGMVASYLESVRQESQASQADWNAAAARHGYTLDDVLMGMMPDGPPMPGVPYGAPQ